MITDDVVMIRPVVRFMLFSHFCNVTGFQPKDISKLTKVNSLNNLLITAPDRHLFIDLNEYHNAMLKINFHKKIKFLGYGLSIITAERYADITGYTIKALKRKYEDQVWNGYTIFRSPTGALVVNIPEVEKWIANKGK